jgi:Protein of unknown function (DUF3551)
MTHMRWFFSALMTTGFVAAIDTAPAVASNNAPFCIQGDAYGDGTIGDCSFSSYEQCQASASGRAARCAANPYFNASAEPQPGRSLSRRRR